MLKEFLQEINLRLFDEGATAAPATSSTGESSQDAGTGNVDGLPGADVGDDTQGGKPKSRKDLYREHIEQYKDLYQADVDKIINKRFKETKKLQGDLGRANETLSVLMAKYGVDNPDKLKEAIYNDDSNFEEQAFKRGLTVEQYRDFRKIEEEENARMKSVMEHKQKEGKTQAVIKKWADEGNALKEIYPEFNLQESFKNQDFIRLLGNGIDVKTAYEVLNMDAIRSNIQNTTSENVRNSIIAKGNRPVEGASATSFNSTVDFSKMTSKEFKKYRDDFLSNR